MALLGLVFGLSDYFDSVIISEHYDGDGSNWNHSVSCALAYMHTTAKMASSSHAHGGFVKPKTQRLH